MAYESYKSSPIIEFHEPVIREFYFFLCLGYDGPGESLLRLKAKSWMEPLDGQDISSHLVSVSMLLGDTNLIERAPINPIVYVSPPTLWLSGATGIGGPFHNYNNYNFFDFQAITLL